MNIPDPSDHIRRLSLTVTDETAGRTVLSLLKYRLHLSGSLIASLKNRPDGICLNGLPCHTNVQVRAGDILTAAVGDPAKATGLVPLDIPPDIRYEDEDLLILSKPAGMVSHVFTGKADYSVAGMLAAYLGPDHPAHIVNRLDRGTSGLMVAAKNGYMHDRLIRLLHTDAFRREYLAICQGAFPQTAAAAFPLDGREACTDFSLVSLHGDYSLVRAVLHTGRTHQIRRHAALLGHPLAGDTAYGGTSAFPRPALHSASVRLIHPLTGAEIICECPLPGDMQQFLSEQ